MRRRGGGVAETTCEEEGRGGVFILQHVNIIIVFFIVGELKLCYQKFFKNEVGSLLNMKQRRILENNG